MVSNSTIDSTMATQPFLEVPLLILISALQTSDAIMM